MTVQFHVDPVVARCESCPKTPVQFLPDSEPTPVESRVNTTAGGVDSPVTVPVEERRHGSRYGLVENRL